MATKKRTLKRRVSAETLRAAESRSKAIRKRAEEQELQFIEATLGEDFVSVSEARRALRKETARVEKQVKKFFTPVESKTTAGKPSKKSGSKTTNKRASKPPKKQFIETPKETQVRRKPTYTIRELGWDERQSVMEFLKDGDRARFIDRQVLRPGEYWGAQIQHEYLGVDLKDHKGYARTFQLRENLSQLFSKLSEYVQLGILDRGLNGKTSRSFAENLKIIKFGDAVKRETKKHKIEVAGKWTTLVEQERANRRARKKALAEKIEAGEKRAKKLEKKLAQKEREIKKLKQKKG